MSPHSSQNGGSGASGASDVAASASVPAALRVGGAFLALALVLALFGFMSLLTDGWQAPFTITWRFLLIVAAAILVGAFVTTSTAHRGSVGQIVGLAVAIVLVIASRFTPAVPLSTMGQSWLFLYAGAAFLCALVIRRSLMPRQ